MSLSDRYDDRLLGELAALADGSLNGPRRAELEAQVAEDPELAAALAEQRRAVTLIRGAAARVELPAALRARLDGGAGAADGPPPRARRGASRTRRDRPVRFRLPRWQPALAGAAAVLLALVVALTGGPTVEDAAAFAALPSTAAAPSTDGPLLMAAQDGVAFPHWGGEKLGWRATGMRTGDVDGRAATTVYYEKNGRTIAYTIVAGAPLDGPERSRTITAAGTPIELFDAGAGRAATWRRQGHTCVLIGAGVPDAELAELAGWKAAGALPF